MIQEPYMYYHNTNSFHVTSEGKKFIWIHYLVWLPMAS